VKERGILFSSPMVRAILEGRKTVTRRLLKWDGLPDVPPTKKWAEPGRAWQEVEPGYWIGCDENGTTIFARCPYGVRGDRLWVRETFRTWCVVHDGGAESDTHPCRCHDVDAYRADHPDPESLNWRPSIFMPRWASRITLEVGDVRAEQLQDITDADAYREGVGDMHVPGVVAPPVRARFHQLWDEINGERAPWKSNPWVWRVAFRRVT